MIDLSFIIYSTDTMRTYRYLSFHLPSCTRMKIRFTFIIMIRLDERICMYQSKVLLLLLLLLLLLHCKTYCDVCQWILEINNQKWQRNFFSNQSSIFIFSTWQDVFFRSSCHSSSIIKCDGRCTIHHMYVHVCACHEHYFHVMYFVSSMKTHSMSI
jgi:hypothetical protein